MKKVVVSPLFVLLILSCSSAPPIIEEALPEKALYSDKVSYILDSDEHADLPGMSAVILSGNVDGIVDWDRAHNQFLEELIYSNIFRSVVMEPERLVDYGAAFSLSELPGNAMQVHYTFTNMHTGDTVYTGITKGNRENFNLGFAFIEDTGTSYRDSFNVQKSLVRALSDYKIRADDISGTSIAVLTPFTEDAGLPGDEDVTTTFNFFVNKMFVMVIENALVNITNADIVNRENIDQVISEMSLSMNDLFNQDKAAEVGQFLGADYVLMSRVAYDEDGYFLIHLKMIDIETLSIFRSVVFESSLWSDEANQFDIGTNIDRLFHSEAR